ncbi:uncharacterized protein LOC123266065 [Cotesia glomerata]|uniref:uncharacterized protein LOC123266065 n=1 Tax=Cotesia glomerata TaxID=32391 RepID=UPI001D033E45|nr:uncharacterized protein LOC123266065 [Cotesia glomerata]
MFSKYVHCQLRLRTACFARGVKDNNAPIVLSVGHNHQIPFDQRERVHFIANLRRAASRSLLPPTEIYNRIARRYPNEALLTPYPSVARLLRNIRRQITFPVINTLGELIQALYSQLLSHFRYYSDQQSLQFFNFADNAVIICAPWLISTLNSETIYVTSTSRSAVNVNGVRLLTTVSVNYINHVFPVAFVVWSRRDDQICSNFSDTLRQLFQGNAPRTIYTDFDLLPYLRCTFQGSQLIGTYESYCRILYQRALELDVETHLNDHDNFLRNCMNLILLPADVANGMFNNMITNLNAPELNDFINYLQNEWIENENFVSFYEDFAPLNNVSILISNVISHRFEEHSSPKEFIQQIIWFFYAAKDDSTRLAANRAAFVTRFPLSTGYCLKRDLMRIQWTSLRNRRIDGTVFLERMLAIHESHYNDMMHIFTVMIDEQLVINGLHIHQLRAGVAGNQRNQQ